MLLHVGVVETLQLTMHQTSSRRVLTDEHDKFKLILLIKIVELDSSGQ